MISLYKIDNFLVTSHQKFVLIENIYKNHLLENRAWSEIVHCKREKFNSTRSNISGWKSRSTMGGLITQVVATEGVQALCLWMFEKVVKPFQQSMNN